MALSPKERAAVQDTLDIIMRETATDGDTLILKGFGTFKRIAKKATTARNPKTGGKVDVPAKSVLHFHPSKELQR